LSAASLPPSLGIRKDVDRTIAEHVEKLEGTLVSLNRRIMEESNDTSYNDLEAELRASSPLSRFYRFALEVKTRLSKPD
jgi:hypothetical protein